MRSFSQLAAAAAVAAEVRRHHRLLPLPLPPPLRVLPLLPLPPPPRTRLRHTLPPPVRLRVVVVGDDEVVGGGVVSAR